MLPFALRAELFQDMCRALPSEDNDDGDFFQMGRSLQIYRSRLFDMGLQAVNDHARSLRQRESIFLLSQLHFAAKSFATADFRVRFLSDDGVAEDGVDGGGLFKEFLTLLLRELMNMDRFFSRPVMLLLCRCRCSLCSQRLLHRDLRPPAMALPPGHSAPRLRHFSQYWTCMLAHIARYVQCCSVLPLDSCFL